MSVCGGFQSNILYGVNDTLPALSKCLQGTIFSSLSLVQAIISILPYFFHLHNKSTTSRHPNKLFFVQMTVVFVVGFLYLAELVEASRQALSVEIIDIIAFVYPMTVFLCTVLVGWLMVLEEKRNAQNSAPIFIFWLLLSVYHIIHIWSVWKVPQNAMGMDFIFMVIYCIRGVFSWIGLPLSCISQYVCMEVVQDGRIPCPENKASFLSRLTIWWFNSLIWKGYKKPLTDEDLWEMNYQNMTNNLNKRFMRNLRRYIPLSKSSRKKISSDETKLNGDAKGNQTNVSANVPVVEFRLPQQSSSSLSKGPTTVSTSAVPKKSGRNLSLLKTLFRTYWSMLLGSAFYKLLHDCLLFMGPLLLKHIMLFLSSMDAPMWQGYLLMIAIFLSASIQCIILQRYFHNMYLLGMRIRTVLIASVYRKSLVLSNAAKQQSTTGEIVNLMSVDSQKFLELMPFLNMLWSGPLQICVSLIFLWNELGPSVLAGVGIMLLLIPINIVLAHYTRKLQVSQMKWKDNRMKLMNEILNGIKVLKLYAWEKFFIRQVEDIRESELRNLRSSNYIVAVNMYTFSCAPFLVSLTTFAVYILSSPDNVLDAQKAFVALSLFNILRFPLISFPNIITNLIQASVSLQRLTTFLERPEINLDNVKHYSSPSALKEYAAQIVNGNFIWALPEEPSTATKDSKLTKKEKYRPSEAVPLQSRLEVTDGEDVPVEVRAILKDINIDFPLGKLIAIVGPVGAGKSSLLSALLGEMDVLEGDVSISGRVAYVPQQAWIQNATLRENILFHAYRDHMSHEIIDSGASSNDRITSSNSLYRHIASCRNPQVDEDFYQRILQACQLQSDLSILPSGDQTEIGEKGVNLSGGQKQRVSIARACYADADVYLLDDPLSAVDSHVAKNLIEEVFGNHGLLRGKTRILVTHNVTILPKCDYIIVLNEGRVLQSGSYEALMRDTTAKFAAFIATHMLPVSDRDESILTSESELLHRFELDGVDESHLQTEVQAKKEVLEEKQQILLDVERSLSHSEEHKYPVADAGLTRSKQMLAKSTESLNQLLNSTHRLNSKNSSADEDKKRPNKTPPSNNNIGPTTGRRTIEAEKMEQGQVTWRVYWTYLKAVGVPLGISVLVVFTFSHSCVLGSNIWLAEWSGQAPNSSTILNNRSKGDAVDSDRNYYLGIYSVFVLGQSFGILATGFLLAQVTLSSSRRLHHQLLHRVMHLKQIQFDTLPIGRILNRFGSDITSVDQSIVMNWRFFLNTFLQCVASFVALLVPNQWIGIPLAIISIFYLYMQRMYVSTTRQLKRLESVSRSPIYSHFGETLQGVSVIRAYDHSKTFIAICDKKIDHNMRSYYPSTVANRWLAVRLDFVGNIMVLVATLFAVLSRHFGWSFSAGYAGLAITYAINIPPILNFFVRTSSDLEANIVSVERIHEYAQLPIEPEWEIPEKKPPQEWPENGQLLVENYSMRYQDSLPVVLHNLNFTIQPGEKVGVVGRTGSGKSSLVLGLFRVVEPLTGSRIILDGKDICTLGLHDVRGRMTIIPQDPVLFAGNLRFNLDPSNEKSDADLWEALSCTNLKTFVMENSTDGESGLNMKIAEGGQNLSVGQRQLVCLARAILRKSRVLVLDEATAAVDLDTDQFIQDAIRREFATSTVITIAHRLHTIMEYDRVLVLDEGRIVEFDSPQRLNETSDSLFASMVKAANV